MLSPQAELYSAYDSKCLKIELTYCLGSEPYIHKIHYLPKKLVLDEKIEAENFSIYRFLHQNNCKICFVKIKKPFGTRAFFNICILYGKTNSENQFSYNENFIKNYLNSHPFQNI